MSAVADKLDEARALIEKGWARDAYRKDGRYCAIGAIRAAVNGDPFEWSEEAYAAERLFAKAVGTCATLAWNDRQKSKYPVIAAFKKAAELAREQE